MTTYQWKRPYLYAKQLDALFSPSRFSIILGSTKSGKTLGALVWLFEQALKEPKNTGAYWWLAPTYNQTKIAFKRLKAYLPKDIFKSNEADLSITLSNGNVILFKSAENIDSLFGEDVHALVLDEASRCRPQIWQLIRSVLTATEGPARLIGNVRGKNWFYKMWYSYYSAHSNVRHYSTHSLTIEDAVAAGVVSQEEHDDIKANLPEASYKELYLNIPQEDGTCPFTIPQTIPQPTGKKTVTYGVDLAKSQDWTVVVGLDEDGNISELYRWQSDWALTIQKLKEIIRDNIAWIDSTGVGDPIVEALQREHRVRGMKFTSQSKQQMMENLALCLSQRKVTPTTGLMEEELRAYEFEYTRTGVKYTSFTTDDVVCALALAAYGQYAKHSVDLWEII